MDNNRNELISKRQQDGVLLAVRGNLCAIAKSMEGDPTGLGCWNAIDICSEQCKICFVTVYCCVKSKYMDNTVFIFSFASRQTINLYPY